MTPFLFLGDKCFLYCRENSTTDHNDARSFFHLQYSLKCSEPPPNCARITAACTDFTKDKNCGKPLLGLLFGNIKGKMGTLLLYRQSLYCILHKFLMAQVISQYSSKSC